VTADRRRDPVRQAVSSTGERTEPGTARQLSELARELQADITAEALLKHIVAAAVTEVPGARYAGISLVTGKEFTTPAASDLIIEQIDQIQHQVGEGAGLQQAATLQAELRR